MPQRIWCKMHPITETRRENEFATTKEATRLTHTEVDARGENTDDIERLVRTFKDKSR